MRRQPFFFLVISALWFCGCSRSANEPAAAVGIENAESKPAAATKVVTSEDAQRDLDFAIQLARLTEKAENHARRGYFDEAVVARQETLALIEKHYGAEAWQARSARLAANHAIRLQALTTSQRSTYLATVAEEESAQAKWARGARTVAFTQIVHARETAAKLWGPADYTVGNLLDQEAEWRQATGENTAAEALARQALTIREKLFTRDHPDTVASISRLGLTLQMQKKYAEAESLLQEAVTRASALWGETHVEYARHLNNLGMLEYDRAELTPAIESLSKALLIRQKFLPADDPLVAHSLFNLGSAYYAAKNYAAATPRLQQAIDIFAKTLDEKHSMARLARANLGMSLMAEKKFAEAESVLQQDFEIAQRSFGERSPIAAESMLRLGVLYGNQGRYAEAEPLMSRAASTERAALGADHPATKQAEQLAEQVRTRLAKTIGAPKDGVLPTAGEATTGPFPPTDGPTLIPVPSSAAGNQ
jgi:tetratricopeptide (TPR) repeat protein